MPIEDDIAAGTGVAVDRDLIGRSGGRVDRDLTGFGAVPIIVGPDGLKVTHIVSRINSQDGVKAASCRVKGPDPAAWSRPGKPDGLAAGIARVSRFALFLARVETAAVGGP